MKLAAALVIVSGVSANRLYHRRAEGEAITTLNVTETMNETEGVTAGTSATEAEETGGDGFSWVDESSADTAAVAKAFPALIPGVQADTILLAQDVDYPPYTMLGDAADDFPIRGFVPDFSLLMADTCGMKIALTQTPWTNCWQEGSIGAGLAQGEFHGCTSYTKKRERSVEFSDDILNDVAAAGMIVRLNEDGTPTVDGNSNLSGLNIVDVAGWSPTPENLAIVTNPCTGEPFSGYTFVSPAEITAQANDDALKMVLNGDADAVWILSDQANSYSCANSDENASWNCTLWDGLGKDFVYVQTGIKGWARGGTTVSLSKKGSGLADVLNPCIEEVLQTENYYKLCEHYNLTKVCKPNDYFPADAIPEVPVFDTPTNELTSDCSSGYCSCPAS